MMKNIKRIICAVSVLAGLLLFTACDDPLDASRAQSRQKDSHGFLEEGFEWIGVFNEDGSMYDIRIPIAEESEVDRSEKLIRKPDFVVIKTFDGEKWVDDSIMQGADGMRSIQSSQSNQSIVLLFIGDGFTSSESLLFEKKVIEAGEHVVSTYPFNLFSEHITVCGALWYSAQSGVSYDPGNSNLPINNYFGSYFMHEGKRYLLRVKNLLRVSVYIATLGLNPTMKVMLVNTKTDGGVAYMDRGLAVSTL
jgi:hypothetical protein